jgi:hypothetical protein
LLVRGEWILMERAARPLERRNPARERFADAAFAAWSARTGTLAISAPANASRRQAPVRLADDEGALDDSERERLFEASVTQENCIVAKGRSF